MRLHATRLDASSLDQLSAALVVAGLPIADLAEPGRMFVRFDDDALVGFGGIGGDGPNRLLRSLVVVPARRGAGFGRMMVAQLERQARAAGVERLHLLTTSAAPFFLAAGYAAADRGIAPAAIAASRELADLCPSSAAYLVKKLEA